jgi:hypothetical protein
VGEIVLPWTGKILAQLDEQGLRDQLLQMGVDLTKPPRLDIFICPSDVGLNQEQGRLSYVVNAGAPDPVTDGALSFGDLKGNGICHDLRDGRNGPSLKSSDFRDGADSTLLVAENVHKDIDTTWLGPFSTHSRPGQYTPAQAEMDRNPEQRLGMVWLPVPVTPQWPVSDGLDPPNKDSRATPSDIYTNGMDYQFSRPASEHPEIFVAVMAGGNTRDINEAIEYRVYQQLMTPNGQKADNPADPGNYDFRLYMKPPLADGDY